MPNTRCFLSEQTSHQIPPDTWHSYLCGPLPRLEAANQNRCLHARLSRQRRAAQQLLWRLCLSSTMRARWQGLWLPTSLLKITHCHCLHYCVGDGIMPARSNISSRHDLSAMYPGVKSVVWRSDAIPRVSLGGYEWAQTCFMLLNSLRILKNLLDQIKQLSLTRRRARFPVGLVRHVIHVLRATLFDRAGFPLHCITNRPIYTL
jgi:hypothetical protein